MRLTFTLFAKVRRGFRFSLAWMFIVLTVACVLLGLHAHNVNLQRRAVAAVRAAGGTVAYDYQYDSTILLGPNLFAFGGMRLRDGPTTLFSLDEYLGEDVFANIVSVDLSDTDANDELLGTLTCLRHLEHLNLGRTRISDDGLGHLRNFRHLKMLNLQGAPISDKGLACIGKLYKLESIHLGGTGISDEGLQHLADFPNLRVLCLTNTISRINGVHKTTAPTRVTDDGLFHLRTLNDLEYLSVGGTDVTSTGTTPLRRAFPKLKIVF